MQSIDDRSHRGDPVRAKSDWLVRACRCCLLVFVATSGSVVLAGLPPPQEASHPDEKQTASGASRPDEAKNPPSANDVRTAGSERELSQPEKEITEDSAKLLKLATELKKETEKTSFDKLSLTIIRKADEIQKLAHNVRTKIKDGRALEAKGQR